MCLAVPMEIKEILNTEFALARQGSTEIEVNISLLEDLKSGDYVIVHAGFAIETLDLEEAEGRIELFRQLEEQNSTGELADDA